MDIINYIGLVISCIGIVVCVIRLLYGILIDEKMPYPPMVFKIGFVFTIIGILIIIVNILLRIKIENT